MKNRAGQCVGSAVAVLVWAIAGCGGATSIDERWDSDVAPALPGDETAPGSSGGRPFACAGADRLASSWGYVYASEPDFWLGSQSYLPLRVDGPGFFASRAPLAPHETSFSSGLQLLVGPDGTLEDEAGNTVLGYLPRFGAGGPCVGPLRAPVFAPPRPTSRIILSMNVDARDHITTFDVLQPNTTANFSVSSTVFDAVGGQHYLDVYFGKESQGLVRYHVLMDGSDLEGGTPGVYVEVGQGALQFTVDGVLDIATAPEVCVSFSGGAPPGQCIALDFGPDITNDGGGFLQVTSLADYSAVYSMSVDGLGAGTATDIGVDLDGGVMVGFDSGDALFIGKLALARFAREAGLEADEDGRLRATPRSGPAQFGNPLAPGRGSVRVVTEPESTPVLIDSSLSL